MEIQKSSTIATNKRTTTISIGASRVGKTHFIGTIADHSKLFILDLEDGLKTIAGKSFDYKTCNTWVEAEQVMAWFFTGGQSEYTHFAIDSINRLQSYLVDDVKEKPDEHGKNKGMMTINKWGIVGAKLKKVIDMCTKQLTTSVHMNVTAMESKDEVTGATMLYPSLAGAFKHEVLGYFDTIMFHRTALDKGEQKYWIQLAGDTRIQAGTRIQSLKDKYGAIMPCDYACIAECIGE